MFNNNPSARNKYLRVCRSSFAISLAKSVSLSIILKEYLCLNKFFRYSNRYSQILFDECILHFELFLCILFQNTKYLHFFFSPLQFSDRYFTNFENCPQNNIIYYYNAPKNFLRFHRIRRHHVACILYIYLQQGWTGNTNWLRGNRKFEPIIKYLQVIGPNLFKYQKCSPGPGGDSSPAILAIPPMGHDLQLKFNMPP